MNALKIQQEQAEKSQKKGKIISRVFLGTGAVSFGVMGAGLFLGEQAYADYKAVSSTDQIADPRSDVELWDTVTVAGGIVGGITALLGLTAPVLYDNPENYDPGIARVSRELAELKGGL